MTFKQALELNAHVRKGEKGSLVVYANSITRTEYDDATGEDVERPRDPRERSRRAAGSGGAAIHDPDYPAGCGDGGGSARSERSYALRLHSGVQDR